MNMKTNYLKLNSWAVAALMGMCSLAACSDDNSGEGGGNGDSEEVIANNGTLKGSVDGSKTVILTKGYNFSLDGEYIVKAGSTLKIGEGVTISAKSDDATIDYILVEQGAKIEGRYCLRTDCHDCRYQRTGSMGRHPHLRQSPDQYRIDR